MKAVKVVLSPILLKSAEAGARVYISNVTFGEEGHGRFWLEDRIREPAPALVGEEGEVVREKVWNDILRILKEQVPEVGRLVEEI